MADISKIKLPGDNTTYNIKDTTARSQSGVTGVKGSAESSYRTGNVSLTPANIGAIASNSNGNTQNLYRPLQLNGLNDPTLDAKINTLRANRLAFLPADQIIIEKTTDGGATWVDAGIANSTKTGLFSETRAGVAIPLLNNRKDTKCGLRVTFTAMKYNVPSGTAETSKYNYWNSNYVVSTERYNQLKEMYFWISTSGGTGINVKLERASGASSTTWSTAFENSNYAMTGWSGNDYIRFSQGVFGGGTTQTTNYWNYRLTFMTAGIGSEQYIASAMAIMEIRGYGDTWWTAGNEYAANDKIFTHDYLKNVYFPGGVYPLTNDTYYLGGTNAKWKGVYATSFVGPLTGNVTGNVSGTASNVTGTVAVANGGTGQTTAKNAANVFMNALDTGSSTPVDADYYISQYVSGGTTTTTYHRRPMSALWEYVKGKISSVLGLTVTNYGGTSAKATADASGNTITSYYAPKSTAVTNVALATNKITKTINGTTTDVVTAATTGAYGITKLSTSTSSTATDLAATPSAVKSAYDLANTANGTANTALSGVNGTLIYDHTYTITNGVATFVPHVYLKGQEVTSNYAASCFTWKYRLANSVTSGTPTYVNLTTDTTTKGCSVAITTLGYGGYVLGQFTSPA